MGGLVEIGFGTVDKVLQQWQTDVDGVSRLTSSYDIAGWPLVLDKILDKSQDALRPSI